ncbi:EAL domain-containing protein [Kineococcus sp. T13]|uniref:EAL domain-containing protein n=1 Tax=Kineococcus vitellinus TaxID=2696565 RepID=UPI001411D2C8|nr:EAL domain-containing protein [Kineococcus vitellinus]
MSRATDPAEATAPAAVRACLLALGAGVVLLAAALVLDRGLLSRAWWDEWGYDGLVLGAGLLVLARAVARPAGRAGWALLGAGLLSTSAGNVVSLLAERAGQPPPSPSAVDVLWLAAYPLQAAGVLALLLGGDRRFRRSTVLDALVAALGVAALAAWAAGPATAGVGGPPAAQLTALAYPAGALLLLSLTAAGLALLGWPLRSAAGTLAAAFLVGSGADLTYLLLAARGRYAEGTLLDALWPLSALLVAVAAWRVRRAGGEPRVGVSLLLVPAVVTSTSLLVLLAHVVGHRPPAVAELLAAASVLAVLARTVATFREVTELVDTRRLAVTDDLTGLPNRRRFLAAVRDGVREVEAGRSGGGAVLLLDLDRFKEVNDTLGHRVGDELLRRLGLRLQEALGGRGLLARLGGDEFGVLLPGADEEAAVDAARLLLRATGEPCELEGISLHVDVSIGIALCPQHARSVGGLLQHADVAMYRAKAARSGWQLSSGPLDPGGRDRLTTVADLRRGLGRDELVLHYQPKLDLRSGAVTGVEALVRWQHPDRGLLTPDAFLALAEHSGLMRPLTRAVLRLALRQAADWWRAGHELSVAVNLSASDLLDAQLPTRVQELLAAAGLPARALELEITETVLVADPVRAHQVLRALRALGVRIAVDDYGTGYSSLSYLQDLPVDDLKLDRSFVVRSAGDERSAAIVRSTTALAHALGLRITAEGVESEEVLTQLRAAGCDAAQGYHVARPQPADVFTAWFSARCAAARDERPAAAR